MLFLVFASPRGKYQENSNSVPDALVHNAVTLFERFLFGWAHLDPDCANLKLGSD